MGLTSHSAIQVVKIGMERSRLSARSGFSKSSVVYFFGHCSFYADFCLPSCYYPAYVHSRVHEINGTHTTVVFFYVCSMMMACFTGHVNVAITLKQHGASLSVKDQGGIH